MIAVVQVRKWKKIRFREKLGLYCNPKTMGYAHGSKKAEADE